MTSAILAILLASLTVAARATVPAAERAAARRDPRTWRDQ